MASILDRYGIKEVADVTFYKIKDDGTPGDPVLVLDTLKVSTIEQTAEQADARGGKGNPKLITWDYGKEISVTIEDALFSPKSMAILFGNGKAGTPATATQTRNIMARVVPSSSPTSSGALDYIVADIYDATDGSVRKKIDMQNSPARAGMTTWTAAGLKAKRLISEDGSLIKTINATNTLGDITAQALYFTPGEKLFFEYEYNVTRSEIVVSGDTFPGTYYIVGDTYARSDVTGKDQFFQFIIPKAKVSADETITLQAEGDPTTFNMNLTVLRPENGDMMKLVQYNLEAN